VPAGAREGENSFGKRGYGGPCPPEDDEPHRYLFVLYALRSPLSVDAGASPEDVRAAIAERAIARGQLTGRFGR
jgi:Raf kinase inhibitor-like YbhB/YbcL family protein